MLTHPTPYPDVNAVLNLLLLDAQAVLGDRFLGMYLYGSLASGDFDPTRSDVDFVIVTDGELPDEMIRALEAMHTRLWASGLKWAAKLEGAYVPQDALRRHTPNGAPCPSINEGKFYVGELGSDWVIQRHIIREHSAIVAGPEPRPMIDPVQPDDLRRAVLAILREWWAPMLDNPAWIRGREYEAFTVLTMCRALYALEYGEIVSKPVAARWARWARGALAARWAALIDHALAWSPGTQPSELDETLMLIRHTLECGRQFEILTEG
ncbi:MAG TPA: aminoglycoside adenylyltransferase domain-containing protein [Anaerolineales bacterium]|nr:aminoglycoside adenylyltransferase domain-containing protein [Anaerolineales bacterium]